jgi:hypothetical protein
MPLDPEENESCLYICFDIETKRTRAVENKEDTFVHEAVLLCAERWCEACDEEEDTMKHCPEIGRGQGICSKRSNMCCRFH